MALPKKAPSPTFLWATLISAQEGHFEPAPQFDSR